MAPMTTRELEIFPWNDNFATGIEEVDEQHRRLVKLLNVLVGHLAFNSDAPVRNKIFDELKDYIENLKSEIERSEKEIAKKQAHKDAVSSLFKTK